MSSTQTNIQKLGKDNFDTWKIQIEAVLTKNDHWNYVTGTEEKPTSDEEKIAKWTSNDQKAKADIILSMCPSELCHIKNCKTSNDVWSKLKTVYESKGPAKKATLLKQLLFRKMSSSENMADHINGFFETVDKLQEMDITIADDLLSILLLYSIPDSFENFRCAIESRDVLPTPDSLKIKILEESQSRRSSENHQATTEIQNAYLSLKRNNAHPKPTWNQKQTDKKQFRNIVCGYCNKKGHKYDACFKRLREVNIKKNPKPEEAATTAVAMTTNERKKKSTFCLDSGATSHMVNDENLFFEFQSTNSFIKLADDKPAKITGK
jgi:hypothetical protein